MSTTHPGGLAALDTVTLGPKATGLLQREEARARGGAAWKARKLSEGRELLALAEIAPRRLKILELDLRTDFCAALALTAPVPCRPPGCTSFVVVNHSLFTIVYPPAALRAPQPGTAFVAILEPPFVWHANVGSIGAGIGEGPEGGAEGLALGPQAVCLGSTLPAGIRVKELVLAYFAAITLQDLMVDEQDPSGVLSRPAASFWQQNLSSAPLTRAAFLDDPERDRAREVQP